jgi:hypothetical protein
MSAPMVPIFRTDTQAELLACLYLRPNQTWTLADLARELDVAASTLHAEVERLERAGLTATFRVGRSRVVRANLDHPMAQPLITILDFIYGPNVVIAEEFSAIPSLSRLVIFGSWAARHAGELGHVPNDIDVLVVGDADRGAVYAAADRAQQRTGVPVNAVLASKRRWESAADALIRQIKAAPFIDLTDQAASA